MCVLPIILARLLIPITFFLVCNVYIYIFVPFEYKYLAKDTVDSRITRDARIIRRIGKFKFLSKDRIRTEARFMLEGVPPCTRVRRVSRCVLSATYLPTHHSPSVRSVRLRPRIYHRGTTSGDTRRHSRLTLDASRRIDGAQVHSAVIFKRGQTSLYCFDTRRRNSRLFLTVIARRTADGYFFERDILIAFNNIVASA